MGLAKREMERNYELLGEATEIAVEAGALKRCEVHSEIVWDIFGDPADAYKLGNARLTAGELQNEFRSRRELTDLIKQAIEEACANECPICRKVLDD